MIFAFVTYVRTVKLFRQEVNDLDYLIKLKTDWLWKIFLVKHNRAPPKDPVSTSQ